MSDIKITVRTADQTRKDEVELATSVTGADVIQAAVDNWSLPVDTDYSLVNVTKAITVLPDQTLVESEVEEGNILEVQPVLVAG